MLTYLHRLSALLFYILGSSFFLAYIFWKNQILADASMQWLSHAFLPLLAVAMLYGGASVLLSIEPEGRPSSSLTLLVTLPLALLFIVIMIFKL